MENQRVMAIGKGLGSVPINIPTSFTVITQNDDVGKLKMFDKRCGIQAIAFICIYIFFGNGIE